MGEKIKIEIELIGYNEEIEDKYEIRCDTENKCRIN